MIKSFNSFSDDIILDSLLNESIIYFSPRMRNHLMLMNNPISDKILNMEGTDFKDFDTTFIDVDIEGNVSFIPMKKAIKLLNDKFPYSTIDIDKSFDKEVADAIFKRDIENTNKIGIYTKNRNTIKIGKLVGRLFKGKLSDAEIEKFVNEFKASTTDKTEKISIVSGDDIKYWYNEEKYLEKRGTLGASCMADKPGYYFNIYAENPDTCRLVIMTIGDKLVARALLWKLNSIDGDGIDKNNKPDYFLDRVYSIEDYQIEKVKKYAISQGWAVRKYNRVFEKEFIEWATSKSTATQTYEVSMSVKVKKSEYKNSFPYMDTFIRYDHFNGLLWNDGDERKGGHILLSTAGGYRPSISRREVYINRFRDFIQRVQTTF